MILAALNLGFGELVLILVGLLIMIYVGNFGKDTVLGYWGSILLSIITTPLVAFLVILFLKRRESIK